MIEITPQPEEAERQAILAALAADEGERAAAPDWAAAPGWAAALLPARDEEREP